MLSELSRNLNAFMFYACLNYLQILSLCRSSFVDVSEIKLAYALMFTLPGVPFLYYGDEIGMRFIEGLPSKESGYSRTGTRTLMQWEPGRNLGFSEAEPSALYLPVDPSDDVPTVQVQQGDPGSMLSTVKALIALRRRYADLGADGDFEVMHATPGDPLFAYRRGSLLLLANPSDGEATLDVQHKAAAGPRGEYGVSFAIGQAKMGQGWITLAPQSFAVIAPAGAGSS